jgi:hypothetical protein
MSATSVNEAPLLQGSALRSGRFGGKAFVVLAFAGLGFVAGVLLMGSGSWTAQDTEINMNVLPNGLSTGLRAGSPAKPMGDLAQALRAPLQKCVMADRHAAVCGNIVVLRPDVSLRAEKEGSKASQSLDADKIVGDLKEKFNSIDDKPTAALYAGGAVVALTLANSVVSTVEAIPLIPKLFELVGLGYAGWFTYRYLLFKSSREELVSDIEELKKKVTEG